MRLKASETTPLNSELESEWKARGADFVCFVDVSRVNETGHHQLPHAVLIGMILSQDYLRKVSGTSGYVLNMIHKGQMHEDEFHLKEAATDRLADEMAGYLTSKGYAAYSQSEKNLCATGCYDEKTRHTPLPHKTVALLAGLGWIGKHDLLVTQEWGSAVSMCTVLTDAPLNTVARHPVPSQCGDCRICRDICRAGAIRGNDWQPGISRDDLVDVWRCTTCLECLVHCPLTQTYMKKRIIR